MWAEVEASRRAKPFQQHRRQKALELLQAELAESERDEVATSSADDKTAAALAGIKAHNATLQARAAQISSANSCPRGRLHISP